MNRSTTSVAQTPLPHRARQGKSAARRPTQRWSPASTRMCRAKVFVAALVCLSAAATSMSLPASAETPPPSTEIRHGNTFYAYVGPGENLDVSFTKGADLAGGLPVTITVRGPGGVAQTCALSGTEPVGTGCTFADLTSAIPGVWEIVFDAPVVVPGDPAPPSADRYVWDIAVQSGTTDVPGRVWTNQYQMAHAGPANTTDFTFYYQSEQGFLYEAEYMGYNGVDSTFSSNATGNALTGTCTPAYESFDGVGPFSDRDRFYTTTDQCGSRYKIFFDAPDPALPASATRWDGGTEWVRPPVVLPDLSNLQFAQDPATMVRSGDFTFDSSGFSGNAVLQIDANNDGDFDDPEDRSIPVAITADGPQTVAFDGLDGLGNPISILEPIRARVAVTQTAEIHFVNWDGEQRNGLQVTALNGPEAGSTTLYWNDTQLRTQDRSCGTPVLDGRAGIDSSGGVHGWTCNQNPNNGISGSWGDVRAIDDWTFQDTFEEVLVAIAGYPIDLGDAPASYGTLLGDDGPFHAVPGYDPATGTAPLMLGTTIDVETDGAPTTDATGDDTTGRDDEDGVPAPIMAGPAGSTVRVPVTVTNTSGAPAILAAWIDFDGSGTFDPRELQTVTVPPGPGPQVVEVSWVVTTSVTAPTIARFRLFPEGVDPATILPTGPSPAGEVEDHLVLPIPPITEMTKTLVGTKANDDGTSTVTYDITVAQSSNDGTYDLDDQLMYGDGVDIVEASVTNTSPGDIPVDGAWDGLTNTRVANDVAISAGASHVYRVSVQVAIRNEVVTTENGDCRLAATESGTGFLNRATLTAGDAQIQETACAPIEAPPAAPIPEGPLPTTGSSVSRAFFAGLALLISGAAILAVRRGRLLGHSPS